jgi:hypothetical protein
MRTSSPGEGAAPLASRPTESPRIDSRRRRFLFALGATSAGAAATRAAAAVQSAPQSEQDDDARKGRGYQDTEHVRDYYDSTRI